MNLLMRKIPYTSIRLVLDTTDRLIGVFYNKKYYSQQHIPEIARRHVEDWKITQGGSYGNLNVD